MPIRRPGGSTRLGGLGSRAACALALLAGLGLAGGPIGCASPPREGVLHTVRAGENLYRIARYYQVPVRSIVRANHVPDVRELAVGEHLWIPDARRPPSHHALRPPRTVRHQQARATPAPRTRFSWPLHGQLTSRFGWRGRHMHEGIDIAARPGTPIHVAAAGRVIFSGRLGGYGNVVIVQHAGRYASVYAHNRRNRVAKGSRVKRGTVVAEVGATGRATGPHLHFEIRRDEHPQDPLRFLP